MQTHSALIARLNLARITVADIAAALAIGAASALIGWLVSLAVQS